MVAGLIQYRREIGYLAGAGELTEKAAQPERIAQARKQLNIGLAAVVGLTALIVGLAVTDIMTLTIFQFAGATGAIAAADSTDSCPPGAADAIA